MTDTTARSSRLEVRNPILALPGVKLAFALPLEQRLALAEILQAIRVDSRGRAEKAWTTGKAPMAAYWKAVSVYAGHMARAIKRGGA
jgi:hypothetical protein